MNFDDDRKNGYDITMVWKTGRKSKWERELYKISYNFITLLYME